MIRPAHEGIEVWLCVEPVDFRKQMTGLATLVQDRLAMDPFSIQLFVFTNRRRTQCRILYWERCGFVLWHKHLERARFAWPRSSDAVVSLSGAQLNFLLDGYDLWRLRAHPRLDYASMYRGRTRRFDRGIRRFDHARRRSGLLYRP